MDPATIALIFQIAEAAMNAMPGAIDAFKALKASYNTGQEVSIESIQQAQAVIDALNARIQSA